ncbi:MAG TPA: alpha/beta family hydrolase [Acidimicrobiales bacterium]|nr:alpha/beta family hydrolase [Acidimicrobiales bacterium]
MLADTLLLFPGAGGDCSHRTLVALEDGLAGETTVARRDFPYRKKRKGPPDRAPKLIEAVRDEAAALRAAGADSLVLGGRSMGGRMCSMAVAHGLAASGLLLLSYPLHPPGKPDKLRVDHFAEIDVPCLFISGDRDPFGTRAELADAVAAITHPVRLEWLDGQRHDPKGCDETIVEIVTDWLGRL